MSRNWNGGWKASCRIGRYSWPASVTITPQGWAHQRPVSYAPRGVRPAKKCWQSGNQCQKVTPRSKGQNSSDMDFPKKWDPKIRTSIPSSDREPEFLIWIWSLTWIAQRVEIAVLQRIEIRNSRSGTRCRKPTSEPKLKPTGDFTKLGYSKYRDVKNQA